MARFAASGWTGRPRPLVPIAANSTPQSQAGLNKTPLNRGGASTFSQGAVLVPVRLPGVGGRRPWPVP